MDPDDNANTVTGTPGDDTLSGLGGNDTILGLAGNDELNGNAGNDSIEGGPGTDVIDGGSGEDTLVGGSGSDVFDVTRGPGSETYIGGAGIDRINAAVFSLIDSAAFTDISAIGVEFNIPTNRIGVVGSPIAEDVIDGVEGFVISGPLDLIATGDGRPNLFWSDEGNDALFGSDGNDLLAGRAGNDTLEGGPGHDLIAPGDGTDSVDVGSGRDLVVGGLSDLDGDSVANFGVGDLILVAGEQTLTVALNASGLALTVLGDASPSAVVALPGLASNTNFLTVSGVLATYIQVATPIPQLAEAQAVADDAVNGGQHNAFLFNAPSKQINVSLKSESEAMFANALGMVSFDELGNTQAVNILLGNARDTTAFSSSFSFGEADARAFFIVQDGADWAATLASTDTLSFRDSSGELANMYEDAVLTLAVNGNDAGQTVLHSFSNTLNPNGVNHAISWFEGTTLMMGFEDQTGGGDRDFQDVLIEITQTDAGLA